MKKRRKVAIELTVRALPPAGCRVGVACGPGEFPRDYQGIVMNHVTDQWGTHAIVMMDDGKIRNCEGLTEIGIGWYQLT
jgi:hypothetical protein